MKSRDEKRPWRTSYVSLVHAVTSACALAILELCCFCDLVPHTTPAHYRLSAHDPIGLNPRPYPMALAPFSPPMKFRAPTPTFSSWGRLGKVPSVRPSERWQLRTDFSNPMSCMAHWQGQSFQTGSLGDLDTRR